MKSLKIKSADPEPLTFSHLDKLMYPAVGVTKGDVLNYYRELSPKILPFLKDRPITVERYPDGINGVHFWQKNTPKHYPEWIKRVVLPSQEGKSVDYALINDLPSLLYFVNQGALVFHTFLSRVQNLDCPDFVLFDLDRGHAEFRDVIHIARELHSLLLDLGVRPLIKTSGKTGLHLLAPLEGKTSYEESRQWALDVGQSLVRECGAIATLARSKDRRQGKVYIDVMQNVKGHHVVPPYTLRATPRATISFPLSFRQLNESLDPSRFHLDTRRLNAA